MIIKKVKFLKDDFMNNIVRLMTLFTCVIMLINCSSSNNEVESTLDCILSNSMNYFENYRNYNVIGSELSGYSDSISLIVLTFPKRELSTIDGYAYKSIFNGVDVYFIIDQNTFSDKKEMHIAIAPEIKILELSSLNFSKQEIRLNIDLYMPPYSPPEIQFEYNHYEDCIQSILLLRWFNKEKITEGCNFCK